MSDEERDKEKDQDKRDTSAIKVSTKFIGIPQGIPEDTPDILDTQGDLHNQKFARGIVYHRTVGDRMAMLISKDTQKQVDKEKAEKRHNPPHAFADRLSCDSWATARKARVENTIVAQSAKPEKAGVTIERISGMDIPTPEGMEGLAGEKKKSRFRL